jgi:spore germination protein KC
LTFKIVVVLLGAALAASVSGCWDCEEIDDIGIIGSIGLDKGEGDKVIVSLQVINARALATSGLGGAGTTTPVVAVVLRNEADSIPHALASAQTRTPRALTTGQLNTVICGQALAREGIGAYLDFLLRDAKVRNSAVLATCDTGAGLLQRSMLDQLPSQSLLGLARSALAAGQTVRVTINEFAVKLAEPGVEPVTMHTAGRRTKDVEVKRQGEAVKQTDKAVMLEQPVDVDVTVQGELPSDSPVLDPLKEGGSGELLPGVTIDVGIAAYKSDKLVGLLDGPEARGYLWLSGDLKETSLDVPDPSGSGKMVGLDVVRANSKIKPVFEGGPEGIKIKAEIHVDLEAAQFPLGTDLRQPGFVDKLEKSLDALVTQEIRSTLQRVQKDLKSDIYGFGYEVYKANPKLWATMEARGTTRSSRISR